jgi:hypothetical protein
MEKPSDDILFSDIPGQCEEEHPSIFTSFVEKTYPKTQAQNINVKYSCGDDDTEDVKKKKFVAAAEPLVKGNSSYAFREIVNFIRARFQRPPFRIGSFPPSNYTFQYVFHPEWSSEDIILEDYINIFRCKISKDSEHEILPEMAEIREIHKKLHAHVGLQLILPILFLLYAVAMLFQGYQWQLEGFPMLFVDFFLAHGFSMHSIEQLWLFPPLVIGVVIPALALVGSYLKCGFSNAIYVAAILCIIIGTDVYSATILEESILLSIAHWIFLGYCIIHVLVWLAAVINSLKDVILSVVHKKELAQEFIHAMDHQGLIVYGFIRLVTLWYQHEYHTRQAPPLVTDLERDYDAFFREAQSLSR